PAIRAWQTPAAELWPAILVISSAGSFAHYCLARALVHGEAPVVMPLDFLRLPPMGLVGWLVYAERPDAYAAVGAVLILAGNLLTLRTRRAAPAPACSGR